MDVAQNQPIDPKQEYEIQQQRQKQLEQNNNIQSELEKQFVQKNAKCKQLSAPEQEGVNIGNKLDFQIEQKNIKNKIIPNADINQAFQDEQNENLNEDQYFLQQNQQQQFQQQQCLMKNISTPVKKRFQIKDKKYSIDSNLKGDFNLEKELLEEYDIEQLQQPNMQNQYQNFRDSSQTDEEFTDKNSEYQLEFNSGEFNLDKSENEENKLNNQFQQNNVQQSLNQKNNKSIFYKQKLQKTSSQDNFSQEQSKSKLKTLQKQNSAIQEEKLEFEDIQKNSQIINPNHPQQIEIENHLNIPNQAQSENLYQQNKNENATQEEQIDDKNQILISNQNSDQNLNTSQEIKPLEEKLVLKNGEKIILKKVHGIAIVDIHQLLEENFFEQKFFSQNFKKLKTEILKSFRNLHNNFAQQNTYLNMEQFTDISKFVHQQTNFSKFSINTSQWPFVASFTLDISVIIPEKVNKAGLFCEEKDVPSHEIFDSFSPNQITLIVQFWKFSDSTESIFEQRLRNQSPKECITQVQQKNDSMDFKNFQPQFNNYYDSAQQEIHKPLSQKKIEINYYDFQESYKELMNLGEGSFGKVDLFYDFKQDQLVALKTYTDILTKVKEKEEEMRNLIEGIQNENKFNDAQIQGETYKQQRNVAREIKQLLELNNAYIDKRVKKERESQNQNDKQNDDQLNNQFNNNQNNNQNNQNQNQNNQNDHYVYDERRKYVLQVKGVIPIPKYNNRKLQEKLGGPVFKKYKGVKLCLNFFGGCEFQNKKLTCDVRHYLKNNATFLFGNDQNKKMKFVRNIFEEILKAFSFVHDHNVVLRDFKDDNILIRRRYDPENLGQSIFEIQFCDFGMSKKKKKKSFEQLQKLQQKSLEQQQKQQQFNLEEDDELDFKLNPLKRENSIPYNSINRFRHPRFYKALLENKTLEYEKKDDIFGLGIFLFKIFEEHLKLEFNKETQILIEYLTGFSFQITEKYYKNHVIDYNQACEQLLENDCKNWMECWKQIPQDISEILQHQTYLNWIESRV